MNILLKLLYGLCFLSILCSCNTANLMYDNAQLLEKKELKLTASYGNYGAFREGGKIQDNYGFAVAYGVSDKLSMDIRYENIQTTFTDLLNEELEELREENLGVEYFNFDMNYFRIGSKINIKKDKIAVNIPAEIYFNDTDVYPFISPQFLFTIRKNDFFECTIIPKISLTASFDDDQFQGIFLPGISIGFGLSRDLEKWAIRPEFGYQIGAFGGVFSWGVGINFNKK